MTHKERIAILSIFISVLGFSLFSVFNPLEDHIGGSSLVVASEYSSKMPVLEQEYVNGYDADDESDLSSKTSSSRIAKMLSTTLGIPLDDVVESLEGGAKPSEMLASAGVLLSDLKDEFNFDIVGERGFVRFNS